MLDNRCGERYAASDSYQDFLLHYLQRLFVPRVPLWTYASYWVYLAITAAVYPPRPLTGNGALIGALWFATLENAPWANVELCVAPELQRCGIVLVLLHYAELGSTCPWSSSRGCCSTTCGRLAAQHKPSQRCSVLRPQLWPTARPVLVLSVTESTCAPPN